jgi:hypothetical protein
VTLRFTERPDPGLSTVRVLDSSGRVVAGGPARPVPRRPAELRVPLGGLPAGGYTVAWRIVSAVDGHRTDGVFGFGVGPAAAPGLPAAQAVAEVRSASAPAPLAVAGRWAWYWGLTLLVGAAATGLLVFGGRLPGRPAPLLGLALGAATAGLAAMTAAARADAAVPLGDMLAATTGRWLLWRAATLAAALAATWWVAARPRATWPLVALGVAGAAGMLVHALAGHAAGPSSLRTVNLLAQWAHLLAVGVWIGGLAWLLAALWARGAAVSTRDVVVRFSRLAGISLAVVVLAAAALLSQLAPGVPSGAGAAAPPGPGAGNPALQATGSDWATTVRVALTVTPGAAGPNRFTATVADFDTGSPLPVDRVELAGTPVSHPDLGTARLELTEAPDGRWLGQGRLLSLAGRWNLTTTIQEPGGGIVVPLAVDVPPSAPS